MRRTSLLVALLFVALCVAGGGSQVLAGASYEFLFSVSQASDDQEVFLSLTVERYGKDRREVEAALSHLRHVKADLAVALFLAAESGRPLRHIVKLRSGGHSWEAIFARAEVSLAILFRGIDRDPGPPYGKAWGHWKKQPGSARLSDTDIRSWVDIQIGHRLSGSTVFELAVSAGKGTPVFKTVAQGRGAGKGHDKAKAVPPGKSKDKGKGKKGQ